MAATHFSVASLVARTVAWIPRRCSFPSLSERVRQAPGADQQPPPALAPSQLSPPCAAIGNRPVQRQNAALLTTPKETEPGFGAWTKRYLKSPTSYALYIQPVPHFSQISARTAPRHPPANKKSRTNLERKLSSRSVRLFCLATKTSLPSTHCNQNESRAKWNSSWTGHSITERSTMPCTSGTSHRQPDPSSRFL